MTKVLRRLVVAVVFAWAGSASAALLPPVLVDGQEWLQPMEFFGYSWNDVSAVCDPTSGSCNGSLGGNLLTGWTWASVSDINALFNHYIGPSVLGPGPGLVQAERVDWLSRMTDDGFLAADISSPSFVASLIAGVLRDTDGQGGNFTAELSTGRTIIYFNGISYASSNFTVARDEAGFGAWFVRDPNATSVPITNTVMLVGLGLCALRFARRKRAVYN